MCKTINITSVFALSLITVQKGMCVVIPHNSSLFIIEDIAVWWRFCLLLHTVTAHNPTNIGKKRLSELTLKPEDVPYVII